jgi:thioredoxin 1
MSEFEEMLDRVKFMEVLRENPGKVIMKFGATWCGPCKRIEPMIQYAFEQLSERNGYKCIMVDIDDSFDLYALLKSKKQISGVPAVLCWNKGNETAIPDDMVVGADKALVDAFFDRVLHLCTF